MGIIGQVEWVGYTEMGWGLGPSLLSQQKSLRTCLAASAPALTASSPAPPSCPPARPLARPPARSLARGFSSVACSVLSLRVAIRRTASLTQPIHLESLSAALQPPPGPDSRENSLGHPRTFHDSSRDREEVPESRGAQTRHASLAPARRKCAGAATLLLFLVPLPTSGCRVLCRAGPSGD